METESYEKQIQKYGQEMAAQDPNHLDIANEINNSMRMEEYEPEKKVVNNIVAHETKPVSLFQSRFANKDHMKHKYAHLLNKYETSFQKSYSS